ncbi:MAG: peptidoglycan DD-metalloendopeptidase family protein [Tannerellaceae bacterium]|jgi:murein DD-endopeptidase MepM/ murein hydrolase activator NlpD|nr:peptidoglycan DD-metalloendopeptidase family protein [Tannerellaceae bacterium]
MNTRFIYIGLLTVMFPLAEISGQTNGEAVETDKKELLIADKDDRRPNVALEMVESMEITLNEAEEDLLFPAEGIYGENWDNHSVAPYRVGMNGLNFPDSFMISFASFTMPVKSDSIKVTSPYGPRRRRMHRGIDLKVQVGDTIYAAFDGRVRICSFERRGYGNYLVIRHTNGIETVYGHLSKSLVKVNAVVRAGEPIALGGNTGRSTGSHLHFETRFLGQAINPADVIDFDAQEPHKDFYTFRNIKINDHYTNSYTATDEQFIYHTVKAGENLSSIATRYKTTVGELRKLNGLTASTQIRVGLPLKCRLKKNTSDTPPTPNGETVVDKVVTAEHVTVQSAPTDTSSPVYYRIKEGDNLASVASKHGMTVEKLCRLNNISSTTILKSGATLRCM